MLSIGELTLPYTYDPMMNTTNGISIQQFSTEAKENFFDCESCPFETFDIFQDYYGKQP